MKLSKLSELSEFLNEVKEELSHWDLKTVEFSLETYEDRVCLVFDESFVYELKDSKKFKDCEFCENRMWKQF
jgi:hypothetical protein